jgi:hypothetical protein
MTQFGAQRKRSSDGGAAEHIGRSLPAGNSRDGLIRLGCAGFGPGGAEVASRGHARIEVARPGWAPQQAMVGSVPHAASWVAMPRSGP